MTNDARTIARGFRLPALSSRSRPERDAPLDIEWHGNEVDLMSKDLRNPCWSIVGAILLAIQVGCYEWEEWEEKQIACEGDHYLATAHLIGSRLALQPREGSSWVDLVPSRIPPLASAMTIEELERQRGTPNRTWHVDDRPFVLYELPDGTLRLGLEASRSGSLEHRVWRLRWREQPAEISELLPEEAFNCIRDLARPDQEVLLRAEDASSPSIIVEDGLVVEWAWSRRYRFDEE